VPAPVAVRPRELSAVSRGRQAAVLRQGAVGVRPGRVLDLPRPRSRLRPAPTTLAIQLAGAQGASPGLRRLPSLRYKEFTPGYADLLDNSDGVSPPGPGGGFTWDGRADSLAEQARIPLLSPFEMANATPAEVVARLRSSGSAAAFVRAFGAGALADPDAAFANLLLALQSFQIEDPSFHPYASKYDRHLFHQPGGEFTPARGARLQVFVDVKTANCSGCHYAHASQDDGAPPQLTDFSFEAIGVPRNPKIPANRDRSAADLGLCGPLRDDHARFPEFCGLFKTPTLRNVAIRRAFLPQRRHPLAGPGDSGSTTRAIPAPSCGTRRFGGRARPRPDPGFPRYGLVTTQYVGGTVQKFDDLRPRIARTSIHSCRSTAAPRGSEPPMTEQQVEDLVCFLRTLTDEDQLAAQPASAACRG